MVMTPRSMPPAWSSWLRGLKIIDNNRYEITHTNLWLPPTSWTFCSVWQAPVSTGPTFFVFWNGYRPNLINMMCILEFSIFAKIYYTRFMPTGNCPLVGCISFSWVKTLTKYTLLICMQLSLDSSKGHTENCNFSYILIDDSSLKSCISEI
jgi:hypothetical protein